MGSRYPYQDTPYPSVEPWAADPRSSFQPAPRRFASAVGRLIYRLFVVVLVVGALGGVLFALHRNDVLLPIARGAGLEAQYLDLERRFGSPGWGTPRSIELPKGSEPVAASPNPDEPRTDSNDATEATSTGAAKENRTEDGLLIVSFDSLPKLGGSEAPTPVSLDALAPVEPARTTPTGRAAAAPARRATSARPERVALAETPEPRAEPEPKAEPVAKPQPRPEPVAKAEPAPKPEPPAPKVDPTTPRASDNPLKAAIRASMAKGSSD